MPRKHINTISPGPYHVSARAINKEWFNIPMDEVWGIFSNHLAFLSFAFKFEIHSFVLMSNHYHLLVSTPELNLSSGMTYFQREVSRELNRQGNRINRTFAGRYFKSNIGKYHYFMNCYKYVYQNPVREKIVDRCEFYPYSTLHGLLGNSHLIIPMIEDHLLFEGKQQKHLDWLNKVPAEEDVDSMRLALKKGTFKLRKDLCSMRPNRLEVEKL